MSSNQPIPIIDQLNTLDAIDSSYDKRQAIDELDQGITYSVSVIIDKIGKNYSYVREDGYRDAYYITGDVSDTEHSVKILLPTAMNSEVESWNEGETIVLETKISDWDLAYKQFGLLGRSSISTETKVDSVADETDALTSNIENEVERDTQSDDLPQQDDVQPPAEEPFVGADGDADHLEPKPVELAGEPVIVTEAAADSAEPEPVKSTETNPVQEEDIDFEAEGMPPDDPMQAISENQAIEDFIDQMEAPTPLEQLAEDYADAQPSDSDEDISIQTAIPVLGDVPILKDVPTRGTASTAPPTKRFSNHRPVRPTRVSSEVQEDQTQDQTKKIINIIVGVCVGIIVLMCLCCGVFSQAEL